MEVVDVLMNHIELFRKATKEKSRYWSWIDCNRAFMLNKNIAEEQAKILFMYLASWGMLRNSFLLEYNYRILIPIVKLLNMQKYSVLKNPIVSNLVRSFAPEKKPQIHHAALNRISF